jgi:hypothetical protein
METHYQQSCCLVICDGSQVGIPVVVLEKSLELREEGASINIGAFLGSNLKPERACMMHPETKRFAEPLGYHMRRHQWLEGNGRAGRR